MKTLNDLRKPKPLIEQAASIDPPTVLVLRRKAIRLFPGNQRVATYKNDNYDIEIAIPYTPNKIGHIETKVAGVAEETITEVMSPELKRLRKERGMFKRDLSRQEDQFATSKQRLDWAKRALAGHIKKHGKTLDPIGECLNYIVESIGQIDEMSAEGLFGEYLYKPGIDIVHHVQAKYGEKAAHHFVQAAEHYGKDYKKSTHHFDAFKRHMKEETMMEATIHSLHAITRTQHPAQVRFKDGSSAMIDHPTAAQIMKLHSKVNRLNKRKIEGLINSGPTGIRKVSDFIRDHMK